ncbi:MAG: hypothetical protein AAF495_15475 [Pseudomonadota bacterium]
MQDFAVSTNNEPEKPRHWPARFTVASGTNLKNGKETTMSPQTIFLLQFILSLAVFATIARLYAAPWLAGMSAATALTILILPHAFRHIGLSFLVPNLNNGAMPEFFADTAGYGDLAAAMLAMAAIVALRWRAKMTLPLIWVFNVVGFVDLLNALRQVEVIDHFGATWFIPTFLVPLLLVTHVMIFVVLLKRGRPYDLFAGFIGGPRSL